MKKIVSTIIGVLVLMLLVSGISSTEQGYKGSTVIDGSKQLTEKMMNIAEKYKDSEDISFSGISVSKAEYEIVKENRNGSDAETKMYFKKAKAKSEVIRELANTYNISTEKNELDYYMNETFASLTEDEKLTAAVMSGFSSIEEYISSPKTRESAELFILEMKVINKVKDEIVVDSSSAKTQNGADVEKIKSKKAIEEVERLVQDKLTKYENQ